MEIELRCEEICMDKVLDRKEVSHKKRVQPRLSAVSIAQMSVLP